MKIDCGIIGLPNVGKSTFFNILTNISVKIANFPFCTVHPNIAVINIPELRIFQLMNIVRSRQVVYGTIKLIDVAGLIKGAAQGVGLGNNILNYIRSVRILFHVIRCFDDDHITHIIDDVNPSRDIDVVNSELILFDILWCEKNILFLKKKKVINEYISQELLLLEKCLNYLYNGIFLNKVQFSKLEQINIQSFNFLTVKPVIYIANINQKSASSVYLDKLHVVANQSNIPVIVFYGDDHDRLISLSQWCALNSNSYQYDDVDHQILQGNDTIQIQKCLLTLIINNVFYLLHLNTFFTINSTMIRAWINEIGSTAFEVSNKVHSDFKKGFIRVQVIKYNDFIDCQGELGSKKSGKIHFESKDYCIEDGDILKFLFRV